MGESSVLINLVLLAIALGIFLKLRSVLGRRTGNERPPYDPYSSDGSSEGKVVTLPKRRSREANADTDEDIDAYPQRPPYVVKDPEDRDSRDREQAQYAPAGSPLAQTLTEISLADRHFDVGSFLEGARVAYETIVTAFAAGDRKSLRPLLDDAVYASFEGAITAREARGDVVQMTFIGLNKAELAEARLESHKARLTVNFTSEMISTTKNSDSVVIEGDPVTIRQVNDVWTFERDTTNADPNWRLVATGD